MNSLEFSLAIAVIGAAAGFLGALTGLGGGVVITPALTLLFGVDIRYAIGVIFGLVLIYSTFLSTRLKPETHENASTDPLAERLKLNSNYPTLHGWQPYRVERVKTGFGAMFGAGALKVLAMDHAMRVPFKVSTSTSNFMIGVAAAASAGVYLNRGYIDPVLAVPVMLGVSAGSLWGARYLAGTKTRILRIVFGVVV
ncbi:MAG: sulfite exporter TauE/SafE family protein [Bryobacteraceae bacterium]